MIPTIDRSSAIRKASPEPMKTAPNASDTMAITTTSPSTPVPWTVVGSGANPGSTRSRVTTPTRVARAPATSVRTATDPTAASPSGPSRRRSRIVRAPASRYAAMAIAIASPGSPNGPTRMAARVVLITTAPTAARTGVSVSWRA